MRRWAIQLISAKRSLLGYLGLDFSKKSIIVSSTMKTTTIKIRSVFTSGVNLGGCSHKTRKGKGSYVRKSKYGKNWE